MPTKSILMLLIRVVKKSVRIILSASIAFFCLILTKMTRYVYVAELISLIPFRTGNIARYYFYKWTLSECGDDVTINFGSILSYPSITIGSHCWIGTYNIIGHADIGDYTLTAQGCHIVSGAHNHEFSRIDIPIMKQGGTPDRLSVGPDVWLGAGAIVMASVGRGCVIGAGSIVIDDIPDYSVAAGNPARIIRSRT